MNHKKQFLKFIIPSVLSMLIFNIYTMIDGIYVAQFIGETALSAVNISIPFTNFIFAIALLFAVGTSTIISIFQGEEKHQKANEVFTCIFVTLTILGIIITIIASFHLEELAMFLGANNQTLPYVNNYLGNIIWFSIFYLLGYLLEVLVKTDGFPILSTFGVLIGALTNIVLDAILIISFDLGIKGAAIATGLSQTVSFIFFLFHFLQAKGSIHFSKFHFDLNLYKRLIPIGMADFITELSAGIIVFLFNRTILIEIGESGLVSYSIITYIYNLILMAFVGISQGVQPLISYYYGKKETNLVHTFLKYAFIATFILSCFALLICLFGTKWIVMIFLCPSIQPLFQNTIGAFQAFSLCYLLIGYNIISIGYLAAIERNKQSFILSILRGLILITFSLVFTSLLLGGTWIWYSTFLCETICFFISIYFLRNKQH